MNQENKECCEKCLMGSAIPDPWCNNKDCPCHLPSAPHDKKCCRHDGACGCSCHQTKCRKFQTRCVKCGQCIFVPHFLKCPFQGKSRQVKHTDGICQACRPPQESKDWESALKEFADYWWREPNERHRWVTIELPLKHFIRTQKQLSYEEGKEYVINMHRQNKRN